MTTAVRVSQPAAAAAAAAADTSGTTTATTNGTVNPGAAVALAAALANQSKAIGSGAAAAAVAAGVAGWEVMPRGVALAQVLKRLYAYGHRHEFKFDAKDPFDRTLPPPEC
mmetsp:Transcript_22466/g.41173  ORF Transcript_22466/g.41173 Transcript_22466/m.41173 type:complete len:111 (+) Transcript_22466:401-733(+)